jgi:hypothetical protein
VTLPSWIHHFQLSNFTGNEHENSYQDVITKTEDFIVAALDDGNVSDIEGESLYDNNDGVTICVIFQSGTATSLASPVFVFHDIH